MKATYRIWLRNDIPHGISLMREGRSLLFDDLSGSEIERIQRARRSGLLFWAVGRQMGKTHFGNLK